MGIRQNDTAAVARNFYEGSMNILYPQIDWRGNSPGFVESEFPIYSFAVAVLYQFWGVQEWLGRALNVALFVLSALLLFRLSAAMFDERAAALAVLFYAAAPLAYIYTRTVQPDALAALGSLASVYYFWRWTEGAGTAALLASLLGLSCASLIKPTNLYLGLPILYLCHRRYGWRLIREPVLWLYGVLCLLPVALWYDHAWTLWKTYGNTFGILGGWVKLGTPSVRFIVSVGWQIAVRLFMQIATPVGCVLALVGICTPPPSRNYFLHWWAIGFALSVLCAAPAHWMHNYYQLPLTFVVTAWMGYGAVVAWESTVLSPRVAHALAASACLSVVAFGIWEVTFGGLHEWVRLSDDEWDRVHFAERVAQLTEPDAPIVFARTYRGMADLYQHRTAQGEYLECDPVDFYHSHRKGWSVDERQASPAFLAILQQRGARYFATAFPAIFRRHPDLQAVLDRQYTPLDVTPKWAIYRLSAPAPTVSRPPSPDRDGRS